MIVEKMTCVEGEDCHEAVKLRHPTVISVAHFPDNHLVFFRSDYDNKGQVMKSQVAVKELEKITGSRKFAILDTIDKEFV